MEECKYKEEIKQLETDNAVTKTVIAEIREDVKEMKTDLKELLHNGVIDKKVESAIAKLFFRFMFAAITSSGGIAAFVSWLAGRGG